MHKTQRHAQTHETNEKYVAKLARTNSNHSPALYLFFQHFHRLFLPETETGNSRTSENVKRAGAGGSLEERVAAVQ